MKINFCFTLFITIAVSILSNRISNSDKCCPADNTIEISGSGEITLPTDTIKLGFTVKTKEKDSKLAYTRNGEISLRVNDILLNEYNIPEKNVTTMNFQITTNYITVENKTLGTSYTLLDGFTVDNSIEVTLTNKEMTTKLISSLVQAGVQNIDYINFGVNPNIVKQTNFDLISKAVLNAYDKAKLIANALGVKVYDVRRVTLGVLPVYGSRRKNYAARFAAEAMPMNAAPIYTTEERVSVDANVVFLIKKDM